MSSDGRPKVRHLTFQSAHRWARKETKRYGVLMSAYKCPICHRYHIGRKYQTKEYTDFILNAKRNEERLAGRLVAALRLVLDKEHNEAEQ